LFIYGCTSFDAVNVFSTEIIMAALTSN